MSHIKCRSRTDLLLANVFPSLHGMLHFIKIHKHTCNTTRLHQNITFMPACLPRQDRSRWGLRDKQNSSSNGNWNIGEKKWRGKNVLCFQINHSHSSSHTLYWISLSGMVNAFITLHSSNLHVCTFSLFFDEFNIRRSVDCGKVAPAKNNTQLETTTMSGSASGSLVKKAQPIIHSSTARSFISQSPARHHHV